MRRLLLLLILPAESLWAQAVTIKVAPPAASRVIIPGAPDGKAGATLSYRPAPALAVKTPDIILPKSPVISAPATRIVPASRPLSAEEAAAEKLPSREELKKLADSLGPAETVEAGDEETRRASALDSAFDGNLAAEAADWDEAAPQFARGPLAPSLPRVETAARSLMARLLPRLYRRVPVTTVYDRGENPATGHTWTPERGHRIEVAPVGADSRGEVASAFGLPGSTRVQQKIERLMEYVHEYAHVLFDAAVRREENHPPRSAYSAMTEGFAVGVERLLIERLLDRVPALGLTPRDARDLSALSSARRRWLAARDTHYSEGELPWRRAFENGGETGLLAFLASLSARRMISISRADPAYQLALGDPKLLSAYLGPDGSSAERRGLEAFAKAARGEALGGEEKREAERVIEQAGAEGRRRLFGRTLLSDKAVKEPRPAAPAFALARLSRSAAAELARYLTEIIRSPGGAARLFGRPGPNETLSAVVAGADALPWDEADRRTWMDALTNWLIGKPGA